MTKIYEELIQTMLPGKILSVQVGISKTAVLVDTIDGIRCGLAATLSNPEYEHHSQPAVREAGHLHKMSPLDLAGMIESPSLTEVSIGLATINALLPRSPGQWVDLHAEDYLISHASNKNMTVVGHFPFIERIRPCVKNLWVLELRPRAGDLPAEDAPKVIPHSDVVAITATTLINKSFQGLIDLCRQDAHVMLIGPSTPLSPILYDHGIDILSGTIVTDPQEVLLRIGQGTSVHQLRRAGIVRLVTMKKDGDNGKG